MSAVDTHETKRLRRSRSNRILAGVCGGLAEYFDVHPAFFRVAFVVIALLPGAGLLIYLAAVLVVPDEGRDDSIASAALRDRRRRRWPVIGLGLVALASALIVSRALFWPGDEAWFVGTLLLVVGGVILWLARRDVARDDAPDARERAASDSRRMRWILVALASFVAVLAALAVAFVAVFDVGLRDGVAQRSHVVTSVHNLRGEYRLGVGELQLDLSSLEVPVGETRLDAELDVGELLVIVPDNVALRVRAEAQLGEIDVLGDTVDGYDVELRLDQDGPRVLVLDARVGVGALDVTRALP